MLGIVTCPEVHGEDLGEITVIPIVHRFGAELLLSWFICRGAAKTIWLMVEISIVDGCVNQQTGITWYGLLLALSFEPDTPNESWSISIFWVKSC